MFVLFCSACFFVVRFRSCWWWQKTMSVKCDLNATCDLQNVICKIRPVSFFFAFALLLAVNHVPKHTTRREQQKHNMAPMSLFSLPRRLPETPFNQPPSTAPTKSQSLQTRDAFSDSNAPFISPFTTKTQMLEVFDSWLGDLSPQLIRDFMLPCLGRIATEWVLLLLLPVWVAECVQIAHLVIFSSF